MKAQTLADHVQNQDQIRREAEEMVQLIQRLQNEIEARREESKRLKMPDGEAALLRAAESAVVCAASPEKKNQLQVHYLRGRGWRMISAGGWTHDNSPGALPQTSATAKQIEFDQKPVRVMLEANLKAGHDRVLKLNQSAANVSV